MTPSKMGMFIIAVILACIFGTFSMINCAYGKDGKPVMYVNLPVAEGYEDNLVIEDEIWEGLRIETGLKITHMWSYADLQRKVVGQGLLIMNDKGQIFDSCYIVAVNDPLYLKYKKDFDKIQAYEYMRVGCKETQEWFDRTVKKGGK